MAPRKIQCPECRFRFELTPDDAHIGHAQCPECRAMVTIGSSGRISRSSTSSGGGSGTKWVIIVLLIVVLVGLGCCGACGGLFWLSVKPTSFPEQSDDYPDARKKFKTKLTVKGRAPQVYQPLTVPNGVTEVAYTSGDLKLKAWIDLPAKGAPPKPAVLFLHGGFAFSEEDWDQCKPFRDAGFVTMTPILRGENGLPGSYSMFYDEVEDVLAALEVLIKTTGVDPKRIFVAGHSVGGTHAMLAAMASKKFKACASFSGSPDQPVWLRNAGVDPPFDQSDFNEMVMRSPLAFYKCFKCPARLYWGDQEQPFAHTPTQRLADKAKEAGSDVEAIEIQGDHVTMVDPAMRQAILFFQQLP
jgi:dienelactone hydrolase